MHPLQDEADLSSSLTTRRVSSFLQLIPVSKPRNLVSCGEYVSFNYQQEAGGIEISVARFLGLLTADCKLNFLQYSTPQVREDWTSNVEILVVVGFLYAAFITSVKLLGVQLSTAKCSSQSKPVFHSKPWSHVVGLISLCSMLSQGLSIWPWRFASQQSILWKRCLVASEFTDVPLQEILTFLAHDKRYNRPFIAFYDLLCNRQPS
ncbi:uncharacterized protein LOC130504248 [Raphanus sativus]|uniref:Uncharacterized protein LOC130504248 n=1 Tax=Raphanus sativus TaxID=3726 RepID=A0A9W3CTK6_RAPSA|nr:uncharacterized protein LOC130504248 [Raphanus sativus]